VTAFADDSTLARAGDIGSHGYVVKPFSEAQLKAALATALAARGRLAGSLGGEALRGVLSRLGDGVVLIDASGHVTFANPLAEQMFAREGIRLPGERLDRVLQVSPAGIRDALRRWLDDGASGSPPFGDEPVEIRCGDGGMIRGEVEILPLRFGAGAASGWAVLVHATTSGPGTDRTALRKRLAPGGEFHGIIGRSDAMLALYERIEKLAGVPWTVLIEGETGCGKELAARALHTLSPRARGAFVAVNCAGLTDTLLGSQLFGHRRGAFTGAVESQVGVFEAANGGTLFLDEIGDISPALQKSVLRVLDDNVVTRVGETEGRRVDVRVVCATQRDLDEEIAAGRFRADLLYRLRGARLILPPLRTRGDDIVLLAQHFLAAAARTLAKRLDGFSPEALAAIQRYSWPGNVRELRGAIDHAALASVAAVIARTDLPAEVLAGAPAEPGDDRSRLVNALQRAGGNRSRAAALLGISRATLYRRLAQFGLADD
ncbi:MAG: sigma 54-interacting transcriptional regulator, partial [Candidatus Krumholzibacteria bacterium]|nr:sigma 54-interacting transcriptional regulator [Candidatus Krumholzibacteria bacterium]